MTRDEVRAFYDSFGKWSWERFADPNAGAIRFAINCHAIESRLVTGARVLDLGGGPGRYSFWLAERGFRVVLADLSPALLALARARATVTGHDAQLEALVEADACDLSVWCDGAFDAVLAMGPFYHLPDQKDRDLAATEIARVLRPGGLAFVTLIPYTVFLRRALTTNNGQHLLELPRFVSDVLEYGVFLDDEHHGFPDGYSAHPTDIAPFFERHGFTTVAVLASDSIVPDLPQSLTDLATNSPAHYQAALDILIQIAGEPSILGMSNEVLYVGRKPFGL